MDDMAAEKKIHWGIAVWAGVTCIFLAFAAFQVVRLLRVWPGEPFTQRVRESAMRQGKWYVRNQTKRGDFVYEQYVATGEIKEGNNITRQSGALYGLAHLYRGYADPEIRRVLERGFAYFDGLTATQSAGAAVVYDTQQPTNATALLALALSEYLETDGVTDRTQKLESLVRLSDYLVSTQTPSGSYAATPEPEPSENDYNNGETMYALIRSYRLTKRKEYLSSVKQAAAFALKQYGGGEFNAAYYSWGMAAFAYLFQEEADPAYWMFMKDYTDRYLTSRGNGYEKTISDPEPRSVVSPGVSVFFEGVDHVAWTARDADPEYAQTLRTHIRTMLSYLLRYEINSKYGKFVSGADAVNGAVCADVTCATTRIDYLQHNMSAILLYLRLAAQSE